jgi:hypothetical protein
MTDLSRPRLSPDREPLVFTAAIELVGVNPYVGVSADRAEFLAADWRRPMPVVLRINRAQDRLWRTNMMPVGEGAFNLYLHGEMRKASQTAVGDIVTVELWLDDSYVNGPQHPVPDWFGAALDLDSAARANWGLLPPSRQKELLRYFDRLKSEEAIERNLAGAMHVLAGNPGHYMGRDWANGK